MLMKYVILVIGDNMKRKFLLLLIVLVLLTSGCSKDKINKYQYSDEDLSISKIVKRINELVNKENMTKLKVSEVCNWLINIGLMMEGTLYGKKVKRPTEKGIIIGMYIEHRIGTYGDYDIILYKKGAQKFIIDNIENLLEFINK